MSFTVRNEWFGGDGRYWHDIKDRYEFEISCADMDIVLTLVSFERHKKNDAGVWCADRYWHRGMAWAVEDYPGIPEIVQKKAINKAAGMIRVAE